MPKKNQDTWLGKRRRKLMKEWKGLKDEDRGLLLQAFQDKRVEGMLHVVRKRVPQANVWLFYDQRFLLPES